MHRKRALVGEESLSRKASIKFEITRLEPMDYRFWDRRYSSAGNYAGLPDRPLEIDPLPL